MNTSEANNLATLIVAALAPVLTKYVDPGSLTTLVGDIVGAAAVLWGVYSHWNMKKVPEGEVK